MERLLQQYSVVHAVSVEPHTTIVTVSQKRRQWQISFSNNSPRTFRLVPTVFSTALLEHFTQQLVHASVTFESQANVYNVTFGVTDAHRLATYVEKTLVVLETPKVQAAGKWINDRRMVGFCTNLYHFYEQDKLPSQNLYTVPDGSTRRNIEELCQSAVHHNVTKVGTPPMQCDCKEGFAVIDGNEKIKRAMCVAPKSSVYWWSEDIYDAVL